MSAIVALLAMACGDDGGGADVQGPTGQVASIELSGVPESGQLNVGEALQISATTYDRDGNVVTGVPVTWISSDTAKVDITGSFSGVTVFGKAPGPVTITAFSEAASASASLVVTVIPVASVTLTPSNAAAYVGGTQRFEATPLDSFGRPLEGREVTWSSSEPARATVDGEGRVSAVGVGTVTITATVEGKSAIANLRVLSRPVADWSAVSEEWVTHQRNPSHTGYVPATVDPVVAELAWAVEVIPGSRLHPVAVGGGKVFASGNAHLGTQQLHALDAASGARLWSYDFGGIHSVNPPAYGDGSVYVQTGGHEDSFIWAFDADAGTVRFRTAYANQWSRWYAPVVVGQALYVGGGFFGGMYAFSTEDGAKRWFVELNQVDGFTPAVRDGLVYAYTAPGDPKLTVTDAATGAIVYEIPDPDFRSGAGNLGQAPVLGELDDLLVTQSDRLLSFDLASRTVGWTVDDDFDGQVTLANGVVYARNSGSVEARREADGSLLWEWVPPEGSLQGAMVATRNLLFVTNGSTTYSVDVDAHLQTWSYPVGGHLALTRDGLLLIAGSNGRLTAIDMK